MAEQKKQTQILKPSLSHVLGAFASSWSVAFWLRQKWILAAKFIHVYLCSTMPQK